MKEDDFILTERLARGIENTHRTQSTATQCTQLHFQHLGGALIQSDFCKSFKVSISEYSLILVHWNPGKEHYPPKGSVGANTEKHIGFFKM